jgi:hypothetical protein
MAIFRLGRSPIYNLGMETGVEICSIEHETQKAYLFRKILQFSDSTIDEAYWFPKSQCRLHGGIEEEWASREYSDGSHSIYQTIKPGNDFIDIPDWLWEKRVPAKPMGTK